MRSLNVASALVALSLIAGCGGGGGRSEATITSDLDVANGNTLNGNTLNGNTLNGNTLNGSGLGSELASVAYAGSTLKGAAFDSVWIEGSQLAGQRHGSAVRG